MESKSFCYWLQGLFELGNPKTLNEEQTHLIKQHLNLVFKHEIDPSMGGSEHQAVLNEIHNRPKVQIEAVKESEGIPEWVLSDPKRLEQYKEKPANWDSSWKFSMYGWYNPAEGTPRC